MLLGLATVAAGAIFFMSGDDQKPGEAGANWRYHEGLDKDQLTQVDRSGSRVVSGISLGVADHASALESKVVSALQRGDTAAAQDLIAAAQPVPAGSPKPTISHGLAEDLKGGKMKLYNVKLWDSCAQDGDIVEIMVDGKPFCHVLLANAPQDVAVPVPVSGNPQITLRGVTDGGGGITVGCQTSGGQYFADVFAPGESIILSFTF